VQVQADPAGPAAEVEHPPADEAHRPPLDRLPATEGLDQVAGVVGEHETVVALDDLDRLFAFERIGDQPPVGVLAVLQDPTPEGLLSS
jgi:hypothetical protein